MYQFCAAITLIKEKKLCLTTITDELVASSNHNNYNRKIQKYPKFIRIPKPVSTCGLTDKQQSMLTNLSKNKQIRNRLILNLKLIVHTRISFVKPIERLTYNNKIMAPSEVLLF